MNSLVLKRIAVVLVFLAGVGIGGSGLWLAVQNSAELRYFILNQPTGDQPQAQVAAFTQAIVRGDKTAALNLWQIYEKSSSEKQTAMGKRQQIVISDLMSAKINPEYMILGVEWWTTCCEPNVTNDSRGAGGARISVQFLDKNGLPIGYTFDVFTRDQPYWGNAEGYPSRDWVIRDIYPEDKEPLFWTLIYDPQIRSSQPSEP